MIRTPPPRPAVRAGRKRCVPHLETLEARTLLSACVVDNLGDRGLGRESLLPGGSVSGDLRFCVSYSNQHAGSDTISFSVTGTIP
jgi:hypothetical protein